jgi:hypothetical protein
MKVARSSSLMGLQARGRAAPPLSGPATERRSRRRRRAGPAATPSIGEREEVGSGGGAKSSFSLADQACNAPVPLSGAPPPRGPYVRPPLGRVVLTFRTESHVYHQVTSRLQVSLPPWQVLARGVDAGGEEEHDHGCRACRSGGPPWQVLAAAWRWRGRARPWLLCLPERRQPGHTRSLIFISIGRMSID